MSEAKDEIISRVRTALRDQPADRTVPRDYRTIGSGDVESRCALFIARLEDYKAATRITTTVQLPAVIADALARRGLTSLVVPAGIEAAWVSLVHGADLWRDDATAPLTTATLDTCDGTLTACAVAIAETGTIVLDGGPGQGRRLLSLVPDYHLCVVFAEQIVDVVPEAVRRISPTSPQTWISGPSATSDIELQRVEGVHGPRALEVILVTK